MAESQLLESIRHLFEECIPFNKHLGLTITRLEEGAATLELPFRGEFIGDPRRPAMHGGVISMLLDTCGGAAVFATLTHPDDRASTVDLRVDFLRPGRAETLIAEARIIRAGNRVAVAQLKAYHPGNASAPVATGTGVYNVRRVEDAPAEI